ncbi:MAG: OmpA family protein [Chitinophagales bacterium]
MTKIGSFYQKINFFYWSAVWISLVFVWWWVCKINPILYASKYGEEISCQQLSCWVCWTNSTVKTPALLIQNNEGETVVQNTKNIKFIRSKTTPFFDTSITSSLQKLKDYLTKNPQYHLQLTGLYSSGEPYNGTALNLGLARAIETKTYLINSHQIPITSIATLGQLNESLLFQKDTLLGGLQWQVTDANFSLLDTTTGAYFGITNQGVAFHEHTAKIIMANNLTNVLPSVAHYLKTQTNRALLIEGYISEKEQNIYTPKEADSLALLRANAVKKQITQTTINFPADKIITKPATSNRPNNIKNMVVEGATFSFIYAADYLNKNPFQLRFEKASSRLKTSPELIHYLDAINYFLQNTTNHIIQVTGHTDNTGISSHNKPLGLKRAKEVRRLLLKVGIPDSQILVTSAGDSAPIADNNSETGRNLNRRVTVQIVKVNTKPK